MKRVNIHLEDETLKKLDDLIKQIENTAPYGCYGKAKRASLIRFAISETFGFRTQYEYNLREDLEKIKVIKKIKKGNK